MKIIQTRRSVREYKNEEIPIEILREIVDAGRYAPSPHNVQPWEFIIVHKKESCDTVFSHLEWFIEPDENSRPTAYIIVLTEKKNLKKTSIIASLGACIQNILLSSWSYGIGSCWIGSIKNKNALKDFLGIPEKFTIFSVLSLGYPKNIPQAVDTDSILKPFLKDGKVFVPKIRLNRLLHIEKF